MFKENVVRLCRLMSAHRLHSFRNGVLSLPSDQTVFLASWATLRGARFVASVVASVAVLKLKR